MRSSLLGGGQKAKLVASAKAGCAKTRDFGYQSPTPAFFSATWLCLGNGIGSKPAEAAEDVAFKLPQRGSVCMCCDTAVRSIRFLCYYTLMHFGVTSSLALSLYPLCWNAETLSCPTRWACASRRRRPCPPSGPWWRRGPGRCGARSGDPPGEGARGLVVSGLIDNDALVCEWQMTRSLSSFTVWAPRAFGAQRTHQR